MDLRGSAFEAMAHGWVFRRLGWRGRGRRGEKTYVGHGLGCVRKDIDPAAPFLGVGGSLGTGRGGGGESLRRAAIHLGGGGDDAGWKANSRRYLSHMSPPPDLTRGMTVRTESRATASFSRLSLFRKRKPLFVRFVSRMTTV